MNNHASTCDANEVSKWETEAKTGEWNTAANWLPANVPTNTAVFDTSHQTEITFDSKCGAKVNKIVFNADARPFAFKFSSPAPDQPALTIAGDGVSNNSTNIQSFVIASTATKYIYPQLKFTNSATAGDPSVYYTAGPTTPQSAGGGVIGFYDESTAGSANFIVTTGAGTPPPDNSTVGGEVSFSDKSSAGDASFTIYGSTSKTDGDTFGNTVFHDFSTAANASFTNAGGTQNGGDGGNTQFYNNSTAANGFFHNIGGTVDGSNGGDVAFDGTSTAANGFFHNEAATHDGGYGGVTSFNNNPPSLKTNTLGASAGNGTFFNYGAKKTGEGGGHTFFTAKYGTPSAAEGTFTNYGSAVAGSSSGAGHTVFSISLPQKEHNYYPTADKATFWNFPGTAEGAAGGYTEFTVYSNNGDQNPCGNKVPTAGNATIINLGAATPKAKGGQTSFGGNATAENAKLIAFGGSNGGEGGQIAFYDASTGGAATVELSGNAVLNIGDHTSGLTIGVLELAGGSVSIQLGSQPTSLTLSGELILKSDSAEFSLWKKDGGGFEFNTAYTVLTASNLCNFTACQFRGSSIDDIHPTFTIVGNNLQVSFNK
jgi:hypothetical protein